MRRLLTPRWIAGHLLAAVGVVAFVSFGFWQLDRYGQKRDIREAVEAAAEAEPVEIGSVAGDTAYPVVAASGEYDPAMEMAVFRSREGRSGYHLLTPLRLDGGPAILVDRGWVPQSEFDSGAAAVEAAPVAGRVEVIGQVWPAEAGEVPGEFPQATARIDPAIPAAFAPYPFLDGYLILFDQAPAQGSPALPDPPEVSLGPHLGYAGQWFLFAAVVAVGYPLLLRRVSRP